MSKTGESYTTARANLPPRARRAPDGTYPFDRFHDNAREALATAQAEAARAGVGMILPEHVLLGLLRSRRGIAARVLRGLGVGVREVRTGLAARGRQKIYRHPAGRIIPADSTKRVIEQAFQEARQRGSELVGTEHLLLAILSETDDPACGVLAQLGATAERTAPLLASPPPPARRRRPSPPPPPVPAPSPTSEVMSAIQRGRTAAEAEGAMFLRSDHLLSQLVGPDSPAPALVDLLRASGTDLEELRRRLKPPRRVTRLQAEIWRLRREEDAAVRAGDDGQAKALLADEARLRDQLAAALDAWSDGWAKPRAAARARP